MKRKLLPLMTTSIVLIGLTFQLGYSMDREEIKLSDLPPEIITLVIKYCPKENYNDFSIVCKDFLDITNGLTEQCKFKAPFILDEPIEQGILKRFSRLTSLDLRSNAWITNEDLEDLPNLISLNLTLNTQITDKGLRMLPNLTSLDLTLNTMITDAGLKEHPNLTSLNLSGNGVITDKGLKELPGLIVVIRRVRTLK